MAKMMLSRISAASLSLIVERAKAEGMELLEAFCSIADEPSIDSLRMNDFSFSGLKIYLEKYLENFNEPLHAEKPPLEIASERDIEEMKSIFHGVFSSSRYYSYPCLSPKKVNELYNTWIKKSVSGAFDDVCLLMRQENKIAGVCTVKLFPHKARIGLFAVNPLFQGKGIGSSLLSGVSNWLRSRSIPTLAIATQGKNIPALRLYEANGFRTTSLEMCFHRQLL
jgi:dTDP-4-amino-4,6-dideoxy-D-galactose acyltransferase